MSDSKISASNEASELVEQAPEPIAEDDHHAETTTSIAQSEERLDPPSKQASQTPISATDRPTSRELTPEQRQAESTLIEAFPSIESKVVKAVLLASGGNLEQAFNALLSMSDPSFDAPDPRPVAPPPQTAAEQRQMQRDEMYARQLAEHYQTTQRPARSRMDADGPPLPNRSQSDQYRLDQDERERNFFDDDLTEIKEGVKKTFLETQKTFTSWVSKIQKKLEGDDQDPYNGPPALHRPENSQYGRRSDSRGHRHDRMRRSGDTDAFDADPRVIGDNFDDLELRDDYSIGSEPQGPRLPGRPAANPDIFKPTPPTPPQSGPVDEVDAAERRQNTSAPMSGGKSAKWQPLTSLDPAADAEDNDPFSVGDDADDDTPADANEKTKDLREADSARLKEAARQSNAADGKPESQGLEEQEKGSIDTKDKTAEMLLTSDVPVSVPTGPQAASNGDEKKEDRTDDQEASKDGTKGNRKGAKRGSKKDSK